jgi:hypothetical protein
MIAHASLEISEGRRRSSIVHAVIALEAASGRALKHLLATRVKGLETDKTLNAIVREVSLPTRARVVYGHLELQAETPVEWSKIESLYECRNTIIHRNRRRLPKAPDIVEQLLAVWTFVSAIDAALHTQGYPTQPESDA